MFNTSTQCKYWMFENEEELHRLSAEANDKYIQFKLNQNGGQSISFIKPHEERILCKYYETVLKEFCKKFKPQMPKSVVAMAFQYFKRFYLNNSVMDYHPKNILVTCVYLACKVDEFNVSMDQFVFNIKGDRQKAADIILNNELLLMQQLKYHLNVHSPIRPIEGFLIDIKTRFSLELDENKLRAEIDDYIDKSFSTNACFLFSPSQIALSAVIVAATKVGVNLDQYVMTLFNDDAAQIQRIQDVTKSIIKMITLNQKETQKQKEIREQVKHIEQRLEQCRNQANNPDSKEYKRALDDDLNEDTVPYEKYAKLSEEQRRIDEMYVESHASNKNYH